MSGVAVIRHLLANNAGVVAIVPATSIMAGTLRVGWTAPAILVSLVDSVTQNYIRTNTSGREHTDRVQVSALFKDTEGTPAGTGYPGLDALMKLLIPACPSQRGTVNGVAVQSITPDIEGPDLENPEMAMVSRSRDFLVRWTGA